MTSIVVLEHLIKWLMKALDGLCDDQLTRHFPYLNDAVFWWIPLLVFALQQELPERPHQGMHGLGQSRTKDSSLPLDTSISVV